MAVQTRTDTFAALRDCFAADLAALIGDQAPRGTTPNAFNDLVEEVRDVLAASSIGTWREASEELDRAAGHAREASPPPGLTSGRRGTLSRALGVRLRAFRASVVFGQLVRHQSCAARRAGLSRRDNPPPLRFADHRVSRRDNRRPPAE